MRNLCLLVAVSWMGFGLLSPVALAQSEQALELRNVGIAQLENERPTEAESTFRRLIQTEPNDPLGFANLAIALLRQQENDEALAAIDLALRKAPGRGDLLAIKGEVLVWSEKIDQALEVYRSAAQAAPRDLEILYALYRHASSSRSDAAEEILETTLRDLARLRPENLVILLQLGRRAVEANDREVASRTLLRIRELLWQAPPVAATLLAEALTALEAGDVERARGPAFRLANFLRSTPIFKASQSELYTDIQGIPVERFRGEPPASPFGDRIEVSFTASTMDSKPTLGSALVVADLDGDNRPDVARIQEGSSPILEIRKASDEWQASIALEAPAVPHLLALDLDNDGHLDLLGYGGESSVVFWRGSGQGRFENATEAFGLEGVKAGAAAAFDFDSEGDLDLAISGPGEAPLDLFWNSLEGPMRAVGEDSFPQLRPRHVHQLLPTDLDRDGDLDLLLAHSRGLTWLDNLRQGRFRNRTAIGGLREIAAARAVISCDLNNDLRPDLVFADTGLHLLRNNGVSFHPQQNPPGLPQEGDFTSLLAFDADNDGRLDLAAAGAPGVLVLAQDEAGAFSRLPVQSDLSGTTALAASDLDGDGDLDLVAGGPFGLRRLENLGGNRNHWLTVRLQGLNKGNDKNNFFGLGATLEVRAGSGYQYREANQPTSHFGLGSRKRADLLRVVWSNGVPQNRIHPEVDQLVVEEQVLKGSCPFLYTWTGEEIEFITDLLWSSPLGMPVAPGVWAKADPQELVLVGGARPRDGIWDLRITEELWEAAFFDLVRLWVVDHPQEVEVASSLRVIPDQRVEDRVLGTRQARPVAAAWDGQGINVTQRVLKRDDIYADGYPIGPYQGVAPRAWTFTLDLGEAPALPIRLILEGWIFPADASLNLAVAQRRDYDQILTRLEVETDGGWRPLVEPMGFPAGKTKAMVVDTPALPPGARKLRIVTTRWLSWDRIAWSLTPADQDPVVQARLLPEQAVLGYRGFSALVRRAPNAPHEYDYARVETTSPWLPFPGGYTRYGDVRELLREADDRSVILGAGDELRLTFDATGLPAAAPGWTRTVFLESHGWDKDADRNTYEADHLEPLPFRHMSGYPYGVDESFPDTPLHREYRRQWLTRKVRGQELPAGGSR